MANIQDSRPSWREAFRPVSQDFLMCFGLAVMVDLVLHVVGSYFHWSSYNQPQSPQEYLFFGAWMAFWMTLFFPTPKKKVVDFWPDWTRRAEQSKHVIARSEQSADHA